jgi:hypothetical protein
MSSATISKKPKSPPELIRQSNLRHQAGSKWGREEEGLVVVGALLVVAGIFRASLLVLALRTYRRAQRENQEDLWAD